MWKIYVCCRSIRREWEHRTMREREIPSLNDVDFNVWWTNKLKTYCYIVACVHIKVLSMSLSSSWLFLVLLLLLFFISYKNDDCQNSVRTQVKARNRCVEADKDETRILLNIYSLLFCSWRLAFLPVLQSNRTNNLLLLFPPTLQCLVVVC